MMGVDWRINIDQAWMDISYRSAIQGNLDPVALFAPLPELRDQGTRTAEAHRHASRTHFQSRPRHPAGDPGGERESRRGDGAGIPPVKPAVLLLAHGAPERVEDVAEYLSYRARRPAASPRVCWKKSRTATPRSAASLPCSAGPASRPKRSRTLLGIPVFFGMRNWHPFVQETMEQVRAAGVDRLAAICLAPQFSEMSVGLYMKRTREAGGRR